MVEQSFMAVYDKMRIAFYRRIFSKVKEREGSLSATEMFSVEIINSLGRPTIGEFADFVNISLPGATYKVNALESKGYVRRIRSETDRRESYLELTQKYYDYASLNEQAMTEMFQKIKQRFTEEDLERLDQMMIFMAKEMD